MVLSNKQIILVAASIGLVILMYFGCDITPPQIKDSEKSLSQNIEATSVQNILNAAQKSMTKEQIAVIDLLLKELQESEDSSKVEKLIALSSKWYEFGQPALSGDYAQQVAEIEQSESAWAVTATTYTLCVKLSTDQTIKDFCSKRALSSFDNALSLNPDNVEHKINRALVNVENPPNGQPMTGILQLRSLNEKYPENTSVINQLAQLAIRTNQIDRAIDRLLVAIKLEPENKTSNCLLAEAYTLAGKESEGATYREKCLSN